MDSHLAPGLLDLAVVVIVFVAVIQIFHGAQRPPILRVMNLDSAIHVGQLDVRPATS